ncbi:ATP-binding protein [Sideroxydans lithotrophicus]|uniref:histidine kinase n=1 Tax=Sideroxydans lithotrophicus (strain ES-1) TaxID=580332 RepID=D5CNQ6_SIDLE|nr:ATP-binding protein [Sideroxydans lithotrophicus]ADE10969.1 integral membrane sensor signal transduction histidine kinase [Sideroxydans lithotrophicus ES-1]
MNSSLLAAQTGHTHLRRLILLRYGAIIAQFATLILIHRFISHDFAWMPMLSAVCFLAVVNTLTWWRLSFNFPVGNLELFLQLSVDVLVLTVLLYYGGGSTNPLVSLYLLPLVIAAATLPRRFTWGMASLTLACYSLLMVWYVPIPGSQSMSVAMQGMDHMHHDMPTASPMQNAFNEHVLGMWLGFVISALVVAYFVVEMARAVRIRDAQLNRVREETLRNERIVALGTQAAGAAHELGTPLSTMSVVIGEMRNECTSPEQQDNLIILDEQVRNCKRILDTLLSHARETSSELSLEEFIRNVLDEWQLLRPTVHYRFQVSGAQPSPRLRADLALRSALLNLLNNAADASPDEMDILLRWDDANITLEIHDQGPGLTSEAAARAGSAFFTTKQEGRGLGLFLANATLERLGGSVRLSNREGGGATTEVILPLRKLSA